MFSTTNPQPSEFANVKVFASSNWYAPQRMKSTYQELKSINLIGTKVVVGVSRLEKEKNMSFHGRHA